MLMARLLISIVVGANALVESVLGGMFAFSYIYSGYNIAVPIAIHGLYDFGTIFITWLLASRGEYTYGALMYKI